MAHVNGQCSRGSMSQLANSAGVGSGTCVVSDHAAAGCQACKPSCCKQAAKIRKPALPAWSRSLDMRWWSKLQEACGRQVEEAALYCRIE